MGRNAAKLVQPAANLAMLAGASYINPPFAGQYFLERSRSADASELAEKQMAHERALQAAREEAAMARTQTEIGGRKDVATIGETGATERQGRAFGHDVEMHGMAADTAREARVHGAQLGELGSVLQHKRDLERDALGQAANARSQRVEHGFRAGEAAKERGFRHDQAARDYGRRKELQRIGVEQERETYRQRVPLDVEKWNKTYGTKIISPTSQGGSFGPPQGEGSPLDRVRNARRSRGL